MTDSQVYIYGGGGVQLAAILHTPASLPAPTHCHRPIDTRTPIAILMHGAYGHKDYLFFKRLAYTLPIPSIRFDFGGNGDSGDRTLVLPLTMDIADVASVAAWARSAGYAVVGAIGHSKGAGIGFSWLMQERPSDVQWYVDLCGRYNFQPEFDYYSSADINAILRRDDYYEHTVTARGRRVTIRLTLKDLEDTSSPRSMHGRLDPFPYALLILHGGADDVVPVEDSRLYHAAIPDSTLTIIPKADHNFTGMREEIPEVIIGWLHSQSLIPPPHLPAQL